MNKKYFLIMIFFMFLSLTACTHIGDTNGDQDFTIETFTDLDIINKSSHMALGFVESNLNGKITIKAKKFSGVYGIYSVNANNEPLSITVESSCSSGNLRIVLINDETIIGDYEINTTDSIDIENANGKYIVKIVGESAKFSLKINK